MESVEQGSSHCRHYWWSVDPGFSSMGNVAGFWTIQEEQRLINVTIAKDSQCTERVLNMKKANEEVMNTAINRWLWHKFENQNQLKESLVVIERQYLPLYDKNSLKNPVKLWVGLQLKMLQTVLYSIIINRYGSYVMLVHPGSVNKLLDIPTQDSYEATKAAAVKWVKDTLGFTVKTSHVADSIKNLHYVLMKQFPGFTIQWNVVNNLEFKSNIL